MCIHEDCLTEYTDNSEICRNKSEDSNRNSRSPQQAIFSKPKPIDKAKEATYASCKITDILASRRSSLKKVMLLKSF
jgi:hypothetical protein